MLTTVLPSYLYWQYNDDQDLQAFVAAYNSLAQGYLNWLVSANLPVYTGATVIGALLDWVAEGLYGIQRQPLSHGTPKTVGALNTWVLDSLALNTTKNAGGATYYATSDDVFKRIITWHFYKGDGKYFNVRWLKRRIQRFLTGLNGTDPGINQTWQISITFSTGNQVIISLLSGIRNITGGAMLNRMGLNTMGLNQLNTTYTQFNPIANAAVLKDAINSGVLELPIQYSYIVQLQ